MIAFANYYICEVTKPIYKNLHLVKRLQFFTKYNLLRPYK